MNIKWEATEYFFERTSNYFGMEDYNVKGAIDYVSGKIDESRYSSPTKELSKEYQIKVQEWYKTTLVKIRDYLDGSSPEAEEIKKIKERKGLKKLMELGEELIN